MQPGGVIWITGLSGSGKSTLAARVANDLKAKSIFAIHLDGDTLRRAMDEDRVDPGTRRRLAFFYARLAWSFAMQGHTSVVSTVSLIHAVHEFNRQQEGRYLEVLLEVDAELRFTRCGDHVAGPRVGFEIPAQFPLAPHLTLDNNAGAENLIKLSNQIITAYGKSDA